METIYFLLFAPAVPLREKKNVSLFAPAVPLRKQNCTETKPGFSIYVLAKQSYNESN